jgi:hypothetical protein
MKLSELQRILKEYQNKYGDLEIRRYDSEFDTDYDFTERNISATTRNDDNPLHIEYITFWS